MRDESHCTVLADKVLQGLEDLVERAAIAVRIKAAEALVDEDGVEADIAAGAFDDVGRPRARARAAMNVSPPERVDAGRWRPV